MSDLKFQILRIEYGGTENYTYFTTSLSLDVFKTYYSRVIIERWNNNNDLINIKIVDYESVPILRRSYIDELKKSYTILHNSLAHITIYRSKTDKFVEKEIQYLRDAWMIRDIIT